LALTLTVYFGDHRLEQEVKSAILLLIRNKKLRRNLKTAGDFFLFIKRLMISFGLIGIPLVLIILRQAMNINVMFQKFLLWSEQKQIDWK